jgi:hypothetical protein
VLWSISYAPLNSSDYAYLLQYLADTERVSCLAEVMQELLVHVLGSINSAHQPLIYE